jgi:hypothetical protein
MTGVQTHNLCGDRQIAPLIYILQKEPMACALMLNNDIQVVKLPGEGDVDSLVTKLCMLADDTQIIN